MKSTKYSLGVDLGGTSVKAGIVSKSGKIVTKDSLPTKAEKGPDAVLHQITKCIKNVLKNSKYEIEGIGIGSPGAVLTQKGTVENPPNFPGWKKVPLGKILKKEFGYNVDVENDANAAAIGELIYGAGKKLDSFLMVTLGTGVGGGIIFDKKIFRGDQGAGGEIGHLSINVNGRQCKCGAKGCIEAYVGNNYLVSHVKRQISRHPDSLLYSLYKKENQELTPKLIFEAAQQDDEYSRTIIEEVGKNVGQGLASLINVLDISNVIVGGGVAGFGDILFTSLENTIIDIVMPHLKERISVKHAQLKNNAGIKGAAALVFYKNH